MKYINEETQVIIDVNSKITGGGWKRYIEPKEEVEEEESPKEKVEEKKTTKPKGRKTKK